MKAHLLRFALLLGLLGLNLGAAHVPLGRWHWLGSLSIAAAMAALVLAGPMRLRRAPAAETISALIGFLWLGLLLGLALADELTRAPLPAPW